MASATSSTSAWSRAGVALFALAACLSLVYGGLFLLSSGGGEAALDTDDVRQISMRGEAVDVREHLAPGRYTVIDFYADWCLPCREITPYLEEQARQRDDLVLRKINIVDWSTPVVRQYGLTFIPYLQMYAPDGSLLADGADEVLKEVRRRRS